MFVAAVVPALGLQAVLRGEAERAAGPCALVEGAGAAGRTRVVAVNPEAAARGVVPGLGAVQAQARCPGVRLVLRVPVQERVAQEVVLEALNEMAMRVESTSPGVCVADPGGAGGEVETLASRVGERLAARGLEAGMGVAPTPDLAVLAGHLAGWRGVRVLREPARELAGVPVGEVIADAALRERLGWWGVRTVGEFLALPARETGERLGPDVERVRALVTGRRCRPLHAWREPVKPVEVAEWESGVETLEPVLFQARRLLELLAERVGSGHRAIARLRVRLGFDDGGGCARVLEVPQPTVRVDRLFRMIHTHLETVRAPRPLVRLELEAEPVRVEAGQGSLFEHGTPDGEGWDETLGRLGALLGEGQVGGVVLEDTWRDEGWRVVAPCAGGKGVAPSGEWVGGLALRRFRPARPARVETREGRPVRVEAEGMAGSVKELRGPFRYSGGWWEGGGWAREEWDVSVAGACWRLARRDGGWWLEGGYD